MISTPEPRIGYFLFARLRLSLRPCCRVVHDIDRVIDQSEADIVEIGTRVQEIAEQCTHLANVELKHVF